MPSSKARERARLRTEAIDQYLDALDDLDPSGTRPVAWFASARSFIQATRNLSGPDRERIRAFISGNVVLSLYLALENGVSR